MNREEAKGAKIFFAPFVFLLCRPKGAYFATKRSLYENCNITPAINKNWPM
jgi:hypothetical protein